MDPNTVKLALISALLLVGALHHLVPPFLKSVQALFDEVLESVKKLLTSLGEFILWFRDWRNGLWP